MIPPNTPQPNARSLFHFARRAAISLFSALAIVLISSRINRPISLEISSAQPRPGDELLKDITLDMRSLRSALESLRPATKTKFSIGEEILANHDPSNFNSLPKVPLHLRNVHLRSVLSLVLQHTAGNGALEYREDPGQFTIALPDAALGPAYLQLYDVHDLLRDPPVDQTPGPTNMQQQAAFPPEVEMNSSLENLLTENGNSQAYETAWSLHIWSGRLFVYASDAGHCQVQQMLLMLRASDTLSRPQAKANP